MRNWVTFFFGVAALLYSGIGAAAKDESKSPISHLKSVADAIDEFLKDLPADSAWSAWLAENGPVYGNYCGAGHGDDTFEAPCLSHLDCVCKTHDFGASLRHHLEADRELVSKTTGKPTRADESQGYKNFLRILTSKLFAAKIQDKDIKDDAIGATEVYELEPDDALKSLDRVIDENTVFRQKIKEINDERTKFEDQKEDSPPAKELKPKSNSVSTQPFNIIAGLFSLSYEHRISSVFCLRLGTSFLGAGLITDTYLGYGNNKDFSAFFSVGVKAFVTGESLKSGFYLEPFVDLGYENVVNLAQPGQPSVKDFAFVPAIFIGIEKVFPFGIQVDLGVGVGYHFGIPLALSPEGFNVLFIVPKFRASVGYAW